MKEVSGVWERVENFIQQGQAIVPVNKEGVGDVVRLVDVDGAELDLDVQAQTFLKHVLAYFGADLVTLRRRYGQVVGKQKMVPLPLSRSFVLVPFNMRKPIGRQSRTGWVVFRRVKGVQEVGEARSELVLARYRLVVYHSQAFCLQQLRNARLVQLEYGALHDRLAESLVGEVPFPYSK